MEKLPSSVSVYKWQLLSFSHPALKRVFSTGINKVYSWCAYYTDEDLPSLALGEPPLQLFHLLDHRNYLHNELCRTSTSSCPSRHWAKKKISLSHISSPPVLFALISVWIVHFQQLWLWRGIHLFLLRLSAWPESSPGSDCFSSSEFPFVLHLENSFSSLRLLCKFQHFQDWQKIYKTYTRRQTHCA